MCRYAAHGYDRLSLRAQGVDWRTYNATRATVAAAAEGALQAAKAAQTDVTTAAPTATWIESSKGGDDDENEAYNDSGDSGNNDGSGGDDDGDSNDDDDDDDDDDNDRRGRGFMGSASRFGSFLRANPDTWLLSAAGAAVGVFSNVVPVQAGLVLMSILQRCVLSLVSAWFALRFFF